MPTLAITINDIDKSKYYKTGSLSISLQANSGGSAKCRFRSRIEGLGYDLPAYRPFPDDQFAAFWNGVRFFVGKIESIKTECIAPKWSNGVKQRYPVWHDLQIRTLDTMLKDRVIGMTTDSDDSPVVRGATFESTDEVTVYAGDIAESFYTNYSDNTGISINGQRPDYIQDGPSITKRSFGLNGPEKVWNSLTSLAKEIGYVTYIDAEGHPHFEPRGFVNIPFEVTSRGTNYRDLKMEMKLDERANRVVKRISNKAFDPQFEAFQGDGSTTSFTLSQKVGRIESIHVVQAGDRYEQNFGVSGVNTNPRDWDYEPGGDTIAQITDPVAVLQPDEVLQVTYRPVGGDVIIAEDTDAQSSTGRVIEAVSDDLNIIDRTEATAIANAELDQLKGITTTCSFQTDTAIEANCLLINPGQSISIENEDIGLAATFFIDSISIKDDDSTRLIYDIQCSANLEEDKNKDGEETRGNNPNGNNPRTSSGPERLRNAIDPRGMASPKTPPPGPGRRPNDVDRGSGQQHPAEFTVFGIGVDAPVSVGTDVTPVHRTVYSNGVPFECSINAKTAASSAPLTIDIRYTEDGTTWASIFADLPVYPAGRVMPLFYEGFADGVLLKRGMKLRIDATSTDATVEGIHVGLRWRRPSGSGDEGDTDFGEEQEQSSEIPAIF